MAYELKGTVHRIGEVKQITEKFSKRELVVFVEDGKYPQTVSLEASGDRMALMNDLSVGDAVTVSFNLRGRETNKNGEARVWNSLDIWKVERTSAAKTNSGGYDPSASTNTDDLPF